MQVREDGQLRLTEAKVVAANHVQRAVQVRNPLWGSCCITASYVWSYPAGRQQRPPGLCGPSSGLEGCSQMSGLAGGKQVSTRLHMHGNCACANPIECNGDSLSPDTLL